MTFQVDSNDQLGKHQEVEQSIFLTSNVLKETIDVTQPNPNTYCKWWC